MPEIAFLCLRNVSVIFVNCTVSVPFVCVSVTFVYSDVCVLHNVSDCVSVTVYAENLT